MRTKRTHEASLCAQTPPGETLDTLKSKLPALTSLFDKLEAGAAFNFLDILSAISEMVDFYTDCDQNTSDEELEKIFESFNICLFCS